ncbi:NAD(P)/FAD-dependent oxidoreductase [Lentibacillus songyuanensis]|uniref:NAD(P)/FAD-dependent oxidoreductase n=1 Tax=Lentibacillus songyuanensis TaxID=3136161 RepID=UPI0031BAFF81
MVYDKQQEVFDVTIVGGGPAGLYAAFYSGLRGLKTKIIEFQSHLGGKVHVYPEKMVWDVGGVPPLPGQKLIDNMVEQGLTFDPEVVLNEKVTALHKNEEDVFEIMTASGQPHLSKTIIAAVGSGIFTPKKLQLENKKQVEADNLHYSVKSLKNFKNKRVLISGGGDSATDWANTLAPVAGEIFIACRSNFSCHESQVTRLEANAVACLVHTTITDLMVGADGNKIEKAVLTNTQTGVVHTLPVDEIIINHGYDHDVALLENSSIHVDMRDKYFIAGSSNSEASVPGLYAAGDILMHDGKLHLIAGAFQDAANAVNKAKQFIEPDATRTAMVSSHHELLTGRSEQLMQEIIK